MNICPHCDKPGVSTWDARWSSRAYPATCSLCGGISHELPSMSGGILVLTGLILVASVLTAAVTDSWLVAGFGCLLALGYNLRAWQRMELFPILEESAKAARQVNWVVAAVYVLFKLFQ